MEWQTIIALVMAIPAILLPISVIWYINLGGINFTIKHTKTARACGKPTPLFPNKKATKRIKYSPARLH